MDTAFFGRCSCSHCGGAIEFPRDRAGEKINCPHCARQTELAVQSGARSSTSLSEATTGTLEATTIDSKRKTSRVAGVAAVVATIIVLGVIWRIVPRGGKPTDALDNSITEQGRQSGPSLKAVPPPKPKSPVNVAELIRFQALPASASTGDEGHPPIPVRFTLSQSGYVTLVIENSRGERVRNLVSDTLFPAGENVVWWDGCDETPGKQGLHESYELAPKLVPPGSYRIRGLFHQGVDLAYEFSVYSPGDPPWHTDDGHGNWLSDHVAPSSVVYLPQIRQMAIGCRGAENGHSLIFTDLNARKLRGYRYIGAGTWTGAEYLARDRGEKAATNILAFAGVGSFDWNERTQAEVHIAALTEGYPTLMLKESVEAPTEKVGRIERAGLKLRGLAAHNGLVVAALHPIGQLIFADASNPPSEESRRTIPRDFGTMKGYGKSLGQVKLDGVRGLAFDKQGRLLAIVGKALHRYHVDVSPVGLSSREVLISGNLEDPQSLSLDSSDNIYISDWGNSHQVKIFSPDGKMPRTLGKGGKPKAGPYDPTRLQHPMGVAVTEDGKIWVAESDFLPKRISVWSPDGRPVMEILGPPDYGGGGEMDPKDKTRFYYADRHAGSLEFKLDWNTGRARLEKILYRPEVGDFQLSRFEEGRRFVIAPQTPIYFQNRQYLVNVFNDSPTRLASLLGIWLMADQQAKLVAAVGNADDWDLLKSEPYRSRWPAGIDPTRRDDPRYRRMNAVLFAWTDRNGDGRGQPDEVTMAATPEFQHFWFIKPDLAALSKSGYELAPQGFTTAGAPIYDASKVRRIHSEASSLLHQQLMAYETRLISLAGPLRGYKDGRLEWSYPNQWPNLSAGHSAPHQQFSGQLLATTKPISSAFTAKGSDAGPLWALNSDRGQVYVFTLDGLFVTQLFHDTMRWDIPRWETLPWQRGVRVDNVALRGENFWPRLVQVESGEIYLVTGKNHSSIVQLHGLEAVQRLPVTSVEISPQLVASAKQWQARNSVTNNGVFVEPFMRIPIGKSPPTVDGKLDEWQDAAWATIDERARAAVMISGDRLYAAYRISGKKVLINSGENLPLLFKTGNALDLMLGSAANADPGRREAVAGDLRLLITQARGKTMAALYRPVVPGSPKEAGVAFSSPDRTIRFDRVEDVGEQIVLAEGASLEPGPLNKTLPWADYEISIPLSVLGLQPKPGQRIRADVGVLRGNRSTTLQRLYWANKTTGLVNDVPGEAMLIPNRWGLWQFE